MATNYERELRNILAGHEKSVDGCTRSCSDHEKAQMRTILERPFLVVRAAGSGMDGSGDIVALRGDVSFPIEVKSGKVKKMYFSGRTKDQLNAMIKEAERSNLIPLYAHRLKGIRGDSWRIFRVKTTNIEPSLRKFEHSIPPLPTTRNGTPFIDWDLGMPLNEFIAILCSEHGLEPLRLRTSQSRSVQVEPSKQRFESMFEELQRRRSPQQSVLKNME